MTSSSFTRSLLSLIVLLLLNGSVIAGKSVYAKYIGTVWAVPLSYLNACKSNCGTCCISSFQVTENGPNGAGMNFYIDSTTTSRCSVPNNGPWSLSFNLLSTKPLVVDGFSGFGSLAAKLEFFSNGITLTYNDSSKTSCSEFATIQGTYNPNSSCIVSSSSIIVIILMMFMMLSL